MDDDHRLFRVGLAGLGALLLASGIATAFLGVVIVYVVVTDP